MTSVDSSGARSPRRTPDWLLFFGKFLRHGVAISSFVPSSRYVSRAILRDIDWARCSCVVELGAGTGPITREILAVAPPTCRVVILERDPDFCTLLRERFPQADIVEADALDLDRVLEERQLERVDHFICGLPLPSFPRAARETVLEVVFRRLMPSGTFRQLTHMPYIYYQIFRRYFHRVSFRFVLRNFPPAGYYVCREPEPGSVQQGAAK
ncbi:MAG: methyltransferase domain-containing protein [Gemmataceae bacterium]